MSKDLPQPQQSEEVDLGQLFKLIGNAFERFFKFIGSLLNKLFLAFVWLVFFVKRHFIKLAIAGIIGIVYGFTQKKISAPVYKSMAVVKQNYPTGESLYTLIDYLNELVYQGDSVSLSDKLKTDVSKASAIAGIGIESILDENQKLKLFDDYKKELDSVLASTIKYEDFLKNSDDFDHKYQRITLYATSQENFNEVFKAIVKNIDSSEFFLNEHKKDIAELENKEKVLIESLKKSDTLQKVYQKVLQESTQKTSDAQTSISIKNTEDKSVTKEYELYNNDIELRRELVEIQREIEDKSHIIEIVSMQQSEGTIDNTYDLLALKTESKLVLGILFSAVLFLMLLGLEFVRYLERFKDKI
ncbi:hypothetical protein [Aestuariivivens insulae]|uniref:hypothetical protein n=1 Tax=Aestuariivivens insulae TaxID=1621988 RepID=UPI001F57F223|nr:hypothetical protein [Aestuariivivens insulae]